MKQILQAIKSLFRKTEILISNLRQELLNRISNAEAKAAKVQGLEETVNNFGTQLNGKLSVINPVYKVSLRESSCSSNTSVAFGYQTKANGFYSFTNGVCAEAHGSNSLANGDYAKAYGRSSAAIGRWAIATSDNSLAHGIYNIEDTEKKYAHIIGNGNVESSGKVNNSNAYTLDWSGNGWFAGSVEATAIILTSPDGSRFNITVDNAGALTATKLSGVS